MKVLCLSNGHGEDQIAVQIALALQALPWLEPLTLAALPIVGTGAVYTKHAIDIVGPVQPLPSGGFAYMDGQQLLGDLQQGLVQLTLQQLQAVRRWAKTGGLVLAVGDIVPLLFGWSSGASYALVGTAKSEYYLRTEAGPLSRHHWWQQGEGWSGSVYLPWERWLMGRARCLAVFPRDTLTAKVLAQWSLPVFDLGNPMMDGLAPQQLLPPLRPGWQPEHTIVLLPGSRPPEAYNNWQLMTQAVGAIADTMNSVLFLGAIAAGLDLQPLRDTLAAAGWQQIAPEAVVTSSSGLAFRWQNHCLLLAQNAYNDFLHWADLEIAMAGTATEQMAGLGKPVITLPGTGPQFTAAFAEAQTRLLGKSVLLVEHPQLVPPVIQALLQDQESLAEIKVDGQKRLGAPGAAARIAECLWQRLTREPNPKFIGLNN